MSETAKNDAVQRLLDENGRSLTLYARQWAPFAAEDIVQEAFLKLLSESPLPLNPKAWLFRVVRNTSIDLLRKEKKDSYKSFCLENYFKPTNEQQLSGEEITILLQKLDPTIREIIVMKIWGTLTFREIAELTDLSISAAHQKYQQGITQMRGMYEF